LGNIYIENKTNNNCKEFEIKVKNLAKKRKASRKKARRR